MSFARYSTRHWPVVVVTFRKESKVTDAEFDDHLRQFEELLAGDEPFRIIYDMRDVPMIPMSMLSKQIDMLKRNKSRIQKTLDCSAIVITNRLVHFLLDALFKVYKFTKPNKVFETIEDARAWVTEFDPTKKKNDHA